MRTAIATRASGEKAKHVGREFTFMRMEAGILENSKQIIKMVLVGKSGQTGRSLKDSSGMERNMVKVNFCGLTAAVTSASSITIRSAEREPIYGPTSACTRVHGRITKWTAWEFSLGQMDVSMWDSTVMTTSTETASSYGQMESVIKASGARASNTAKGLALYQMGQKLPALGAEVKNCLLQ